MPSIAIQNIETLVSGDLQAGVLAGDTLWIEDGRIQGWGAAAAFDLAAAEVLIDAQGTTVMPGLIDSHCHVVLGDYTPRQQTVGFLESYVHGGITSAVSPSEVHAPGRPRDRDGVKALAVAAHKCFQNYRPGGMKVHGGCLIIEPVLEEQDYADVARQGVWLAKFGFGDFADPADGAPHVRWAQQHGLHVMSHSGGASIPGSQPITCEHLMMLRPDVCGHINGGPTALDDEGLATLVETTDLYLQLVQAGNLRSAIHILQLALEHDALGRVLIASDTPTGTGVMPLAVLKTMAELSSLTDLTPEAAVALATGNNARAYRLACGLIEPGREADLVIADAPWGSRASTALDALRIGDVPGVSAVIVDGQAHVWRSRNTPLATRLAKLVRG